MSLFDNPDNLKLLQNLLNPKDPNGSDLESDEDEVALARSHKMTPATIGEQAKNINRSEVKPQKRNDKIEEKIPQSIEEWQQMHEEQDAEILDTRKVPLYNVTYRQAVGTEDVFFQMSNRTNASASCEDMLLEVLLPEETVAADKMDLEITEQRIDLSTPIYRLKLPLAHPIDVDRSKAKYDVALKKLTLILRLKRELDFVNF